MYAVVSYRRIDGKIRKKPRIYQESLAETGWGTWVMLFKSCLWVVGMTNGIKGLSNKIHMVKNRLDAYATRVRYEPGPSGCLEMVTEYADEMDGVILRMGVPPTRTC